MAPGRSTVLNSFFDISVAPLSLVDISHAAVPDFEIGFNSSLGYAKVKY